MRTAAFAVADVIERQRASGNSWFEFLDVANLSMGVYTIPAGTNDRESHDPHDRDEVYVGVGGEGRLTADGEVFDVTANSVVFVKAGVEHHFHDVKDDLTVLVFFAGTKQ